ncbi:MAG TPA: hypothetical protein VKY74_27895 [Chloroflexia bacterium]|nr:hypothetical protein [Chloroflexia bacterium]
MYNASQQQGGAGLRLSQIGGLLGAGGGMLRWIGLGVLVLIVICVCGACSLLRGGISPTAPLSPSPAISTAASGGGFTPATGPGAGASFGPLVTATGKDAQNHPAGVTTSFPITAPQIYAIFEAHNVAAGDSFFAHWVHQGQPYDDSTPLTANQAYSDTFIEFHLQPLGGQPFPTGSWTVQIFANGKLGPAADFAIH